MRDPQPSRLVGVILALLPLAAGGSARADIIMFKDGFLLQGEIKQESEIFVEGSTPLLMKKGVFFMDDGVRWIGFAHSQLDPNSIQKKEFRPNADGVKLDRIGRFNQVGMYPFRQILSMTDWNAKWERTLRVEAVRGPVRGRASVAQRLLFLGTYSARVDALDYNWSSFYLTSELGPEAVGSLLYQRLRATEKDKGDKAESAIRLRIARFLAQAGWYDEAEQELDKLLKAVPGEKEQVEEARQSLHRLRTLHSFDDIERGYRTGRHAWVQKELGKFPVDKADERVQAAVRALKARYEDAKEKLKQARRFLEDLTTHLAVADQRPLFKSAAATILAEMTLDDFLPDAHQNKAKAERLQPFLSLAAQAERDQRQGRTAANSPAELLSLAVSGWLLGKDSAEAKVEAAERLWRARQFVLEYQTSPGPMKREQLLRDYSAYKSRAAALDELCQLISLLPPPEPEKDLSSEPMELQANLPGGPRGGISYVIQLPPEYRHSRSYPVLFALHHGGERPKDMLERCGPLASQYGYILVAPEWTQGLADTYNYTAEEHATLVGALRDLRRRFQVDSDRVFLLGYGEGANMAFDVGLAHPDLFAGVLPVSGQPRLFAQRYWHNAQSLPFYVVDGTHAAGLPKPNVLLFNEWVPSGYPAIHVTYKGRGLEWFQGELPWMLNWMDRKKRARAVPYLGRDGNGGRLGDEFQTMRQTDNRFYWLSSDAISAHNLNDPANWKKGVSAATFQGKIGEGNQINVNTSGLKRVSIWFGREMMIDFEKPVIVRINATPVWTRRVAPSLATLMEDFYERGDRQNLFLARLDFDR